MEKSRNVRLSAGIRILLLLWVAAAVLLLGYAELDTLNNAALFLLVPLLAFFFLLLLCGERAFCGWFRRESRAALWCSLALTLLFFLLLSVFDLFKAPIFSADALSGGVWKYALFRKLYAAWNHTGLIGAVTLSVFGCFMALFSAFLSPRNGGIAAQGAPRPFGISIYTWIIGTIGLVCALSFSPILFEPGGDSEAIYFRATRALFDDFHPVSYLFFVRLCSLTPLGARPIPVIEWFFFTLAFHRGEKCLSSIHPHAPRLFFALVAALFFPMLYLQSMMKDVLYTIALFSLAIRMLTILRGEGKRGWRWVAAFLSMFAAIAFRHDGLAPILVFSVGLILYCIREHRALIRPLVICTVSAVTAFFIVTEAIAFGLLKAERNPEYTAFGTPMLMLAAVADSGMPMDNEDIALMEKVMPIDEWKEAYALDNGHYTVDRISRKWGTPGERINNVDAALGKSFFLLNFKYLFRYPAVVTKAFFSANNITWEITQREEAPQIRSNIYDLYDGDLPDPEISHYSATGFSKISQNYAHFLDNSPILAPIVVRGGIPVLLFVFAVIVLIRKKRWELLPMCLPALVTYGISFLILCSQDQRYIMPFRLWLTFLLPYAYYIMPNRAEGEKGD